MMMVYDSHLCTTFSYVYYVGEIAFRFEVFCLYLHNCVNLLSRWHIHCASKQSIQCSAQWIWTIFWNLFNSIFVLSIPFSQCLFAMCICVPFFIIITYLHQIFSFYFIPIPISVLEYVKHSRMKIILFCFVFEAVKNNIQFNKIHLKNTNRFFYLLIAEEKKNVTELKTYGINQILSDIN